MRVIAFACVRVRGCLCMCMAHVISTELIFLSAFPHRAKLVESLSVYKFCTHNKHSSTEPPLFEQLVQVGVPLDCFIDAQRNTLLHKFSMGKCLCA